MLSKDNSSQSVTTNVKKNYSIISATHARTYAYFLKNKMLRAFIGVGSPSQCVNPEDLTVYKIIYGSVASRLSETQMGAIYPGFTFSYGILMIPGGRLADRFGPRRVLTVMGLGAAAFTGLTALGGRPLFGIWLRVFPSFLMIRLGLGVATAPLYPSCAITNSRWTPSAQRARVWGWVASGTGIGGALAPLLFA